MRATTRHLLIGTTLLLAASVVGVTGYRVAGWSWLDSIYMVVITIFSVGYGEVQATTPGLKVFTIGLIFAGCSAYVYIVGAFINWLTEGQLQRILGKRKMAHEINALDRHSIICGYGRIGRMLASELSAAKRPFVIIESDDDRVGDIREKGYLCLHGDATEESVLLEAGLERASDLSTVLPNDAINVFIVLSARNLRPNLMIIARGNQPSSEPKLIQAGANRVVLPAHIGAERIAHLILKPSARDFLEHDLHDPQFLDTLSEIGLDLEEISLSDGSPLIGATLEQLETREKSAFIVVAVKKANGETISKPPLETRLESNDKLIVMSHHGVVPDFFKRNTGGKSTHYRGAVVE